MKIAVLNPATVAQEITNKAQAEIDSLQLQIVEQENILARSQQERDDLDEQIAQRLRRVEELQHVLTITSQRYRDATDYASVAMDTLGEQKALSDVQERKKEHESTQSLYNQTVEENDKLNTLARQRIAELEITTAQAKLNLDETRPRMASVSRVRDRAYQELGDSVYADLQCKYDEMRAKIDQMKRDLLAAHLEERDFLQSAGKQLALWPVYAQEMKGKISPDNATLRVLQAEISYLTHLIEDGPQLENTMNYPAVAGYYSWLRLLQVNYDDLEYKSFQYDPSALIRKRELVQALLDAYRRDVLRRA